MKILITSPSFLKTKAYETLSNFDFELVIATDGLPVKSDVVRKLLPGCSGYIAGLEKVDEWVLEEANDLKVISRYGVGCDHIDQKILEAKNIILTYTPGANAVSVAEFTFGLIISLSRHICTMNNQLKKGRWQRYDGFELRNKTLGLIGLGSIGREVKKIASGFGLKVIFYDPYITESNLSTLKKNSLNELLAESDIISLHLPLNSKTKHIINRENISRIKPGALLINTARGGLIEEKALIDSLENNQIAGFATDVFEIEPPEHSSLFEMENVIITPHAAPNTYEALEKIGEMTIQGLLSVLKPKYDSDGQMIVDYQKMVAYEKRES